jgi:uncharacterized protein (TIGR02186 family)
MIRFPRRAALPLLLLCAPLAGAQTAGQPAGDVPPMAAGLADEVLLVDLTSSESSVVLFAAPLQAEDATTGIGVALIGPGEPMSLTRNRPGRAVRFEFAAAPRVFVSGTEPQLNTSVSPEVLRAAGLDPAAMAIPRRGDLSDPTIESWRQALVTLQVQQGRYVQNGVDIDRLEGGLRRARLQLPPNAPPGEYRIRAVVFQDGKQIARSDKVLTLARSGADAALFSLAREHGIAYGFVAIVLACVVGGVATLIGRR